MMVKLDLKTSYGTYSDCYIEVGAYPKNNPADPNEPQQIGWRVMSKFGEMIGQPTVNLWSPPTYPAEGCVFIKITPEYDGWLDSLEREGLVERTGRIEAAGYVEQYAAECRVLIPQLLQVGRHG